MTKTVASTSVDSQEIEKFSAMAAEWWDPAGKFKPLHRLNPTRLTYIRDSLARHFGRDPLKDRPLHGLKILDIGCGGGLLSEPLTRLGADMTSIDASAENIEVARLHAEDSGLKIAYRQATAEELVDEDRSFDAVLNMEVIEHVADVQAFAAAACRLVRPGGGMVASTLNRTPKSYLMAILGAEYLLRWLPRGTHDWRRFLRPSELVALLRDQGLQTEDMTGVVFNPLSDSWQLSQRDLDVNYMVFASKPHLTVTPGS